MIKLLAFLLLSSCLSYAVSVVQVAGFSAYCPDPVPRLPGCYSATFNSPVTAGNAIVTVAWWNYPIGVFLVRDVQIWAASTAFSAAKVILDTNNNYEQATVAGTSGSAQPTWNLTATGTTIDGSITWTNLGNFGTADTFISNTIAPTNSPLWVFSTPSALGGATTVSINNSVTYANQFSAVALELNGVSSEDVLGEVSNFASTINPASITTNYANEILIGFGFLLTPPPNNPSLTASSGFTLQYSYRNFQNITGIFGVETQVVSSAGIYSAGFTSATGSQNSTIGIIGFR